MHVVIGVAGPGEIYITDLGSTKGPLVNGQKFNKSKLQWGDQIVLGNTKLVVSVGEPVASQADDGPTQVQMPPTSSAPAPVPAAARSTVMGMAAPVIPQATPQAPTMQQPAPSFPPPPVAPPAPAPFQPTVQA